jgi:MFS family permease
MTVSTVARSLSPYRRVLAVPGALAFSLTGLLARMPMSMASIGIVLLVQQATGSYRIAGVASAAYTITEAGLAIVQGRLLDRIGQGRVLAGAGVLFGAAMGMLIVCVDAGWPRGLVYVFAAAGGGTLPTIGSAVRARWSHVLGAGRALATAFALESVVDEIVFLIGPIVVTALATAWNPAAGLGIAVVACVIGTLLFAARRDTEPPAHRHDAASGPRPAMPWATVVPLAVVSLALGMLFGATEVTTIAFTDEHGHRGLAGLTLACWSVGSLLSGLVTGLVSWRSGPATRLRWGALAMALGAVPLLFAGSIPVVAALLFVAGWGIAPTMVSSVSLIERSVPPGRLTEGMAIQSTGVIGGVAPGAALAGIVVDAHGASAAYWLPVAAGFTAVLAAQLLPRASLRA